MASFGSFETEREVYSDPIYTVYSARKQGDPKSEYAVKVFSIQRVGFDVETATDLAPLLMDIEDSRVHCIELQAKGAAGSTCIAPVLEKGQDERGVWYATRFYPRSVNKIIVGNVALTREALQHVIRSVAQGALDLKRACGRSHGEIRPSNIQLSKSEKFTEAEVVLCDPMPGGDEEAASFELNDLRGIGRILFQLVRQRAIGNEEDFLILPILSSPEWTRMFGKDTEVWLSLCNRLLDPNLSLEQLTLERLVEELEQFEPKAGVSRKLVMGVAAAVLGLGVVALVFLRPHGQSIEVNSDPPGVTILVDKKEQPGKTPLNVKLEKGSHLIEARHDVLGVLSNNVVVPGAPTTLPFPFPYGKVVLKSDPSGATVELDGKQVGKTPYSSGPLSPGQRNYLLRLPQHTPVKVEVLVLSDRTVTSPPLAKLTQQKPGEGNVEISSLPDRAIVYEGTKELGQALLTAPLSEGEHQLTAHFPDWPATSISTQIVVVAASTTNIEFHFPFGTIHFDEVTPPDAQIVLNNKLLGVARDIPRKILPPGEYTWFVTNAGYYSIETKMTVKNRDTKALDVRLKAMNGVVEFITDPAGATIYEAKDPVNGLGQTPLSSTFKPGPYLFIARYPELEDIRIPLTVALGGTIRTNLQFFYGAVKFDSVPEPADLTIGGTIRKQTPYIYLQKPGAAVRYKIEAADYYPEEGATNVLAGKSVLVSFQLRPKQVPIVLRSDPPGAGFYLGETQLQGTNDVYSMPWGSQRIRARFINLPGLELDPMAEAVEVDKGGKTAFKFVFKYATLEITNVEPEAKIFYQGRPLTNLPAQLVLKPDLPGDIVLQYGDFRTNILAGLVAGQRRVVGVTLPELRNMYTNGIKMVMVRVNPNLYAGQFEVTEEQYRGVRNEPLQVKKLQPVVLVSLADAQKFCDALSIYDKDFLAHQKLNGWYYSIPTEAEWRAYADTNIEVLAGSLFSQDGLQEPAEIDPQRKSKSNLGIYDVFGNAAEWCFDAAGKPIMMGGSVNRPRPRPDRAFSLKEQPTETVIKEGSRSTGFRCVLRRPTP